MHGKFISLEGIEGAGKSTALQFIHHYLLQAKKEVLLSREPGGTQIADEIRQILLNSASLEKIQPLTELLLMFASRSQHLHTYIVPNLKAGKWVVSDRFVDASYAYQGGGRGMDLRNIAFLDHLVVHDYYPDLTLLLDLPAELGLERTEKRGVPKDRIEQERIDFFQRVRASYLERARQDKKRIKIIDASQDLHDVQVQIAAVLDDFIKRM